MRTSEPPLAFSSGQAARDEPHMGEEFQRIAFGPVGVGEREEVAALGGAGIVDQDVEPAVGALRRVE